MRNRLAAARVTIRGFKSIRELDGFRLSNGLNILIGANGSGKSNFIDFFRLLREMASGRLQLTVQRAGRAERLLHGGSRTSERIEGVIHFQPRAKGYRFTLEPTADDRLIVAEEWILPPGIDRTAVIVGGDVALGDDLPLIIGAAGDESELSRVAEIDGGQPSDLTDWFHESFARWVAYHFHDTSDTAKVKKTQSLNDNEALRSNAENLAALLYRLARTHPGTYRSIRDAIRLMAPFFDDFRLRPDPLAPDQIRLEWTEKDSEYPLIASQLSDGTLRFICLATALLQPDPPSTLLLDEPELGLHPYALTLLAGLLEQAAERTQLIVSTQSAALLDHFDPEDIIVVERRDGQSTFERLEREPLEEWLEEYALGQLWNKNILGGRPTR